MQIFQKTTLFSFLFILFLMPLIMPFELGAQPLSDQKTTVKFRAVESGMVEEGDSLAFYLGEIRTFDFNEALMTGYFASSIGAIQSSVLRTQDGGVTWKEVMPPVEGSTVVATKFFPNHSGLLLTHWEVEASGDVNVFSTQNDGRTWQKVRTVPRPSFPCSLADATIQSAQNITLLFECENESRKLTSTNGGRTWRNRKASESDRGIDTGTNEPPADAKEMMHPIYGKIEAHQDLPHRWQFYLAEKAYLIQNQTPRKKIFARYYVYKNAKMEAVWGF